MLDLTAERHAHPCYEELVRQVADLAAHVRALGAYSRYLDSRISELEGVPTLTPEARERILTRVLERITAMHDGPDMDAPIMTDAQVRRNGRGETA